MDFVVAEYNYVNCSVMVHCLDFVVSLIEFGFHKPLSLLTVVFSLFSAGTF
jgi:hypothetical protein